MNMQDAKISLIIPCYRDSATLERAIKSVLRQTRPVDEIIVVNDCSPEEAEIEKVLSAHPAVVYLKNPENMGLAASRNQGAAAASGEVLTFLDADDELHSRKIELQLLYLQKNIAVTTNTLRVYPGQEPLFETPVGKMSVNDVTVVTHVGRMIFGNYLTGASLMIHRELFRELNGYDVTLRSCEDFDLWLRILERGDHVISIKQALYVYHFNMHGLSNNFRNVSFWELEAVKKHFNRNALSIEASSKSASIWALWMIKHLFRCEMSEDNALKITTLQNIKMLTSQPFFYYSVRGVEKSGIISLIAWIIKKLG
jgi:glycosyltransferase involved in cell wall biosynthesis